MYRTCLFCSADLGANEVIEAFPVGRRLAFDAAKGRLWVVCRRCERWNLTPMEERWEAIEACERAFRGTTLRVSTDNIGLARVKEGLELVRIGHALRPEMAAWRYGEQFGKRRRRFYLFFAGIIGASAVTSGLGPVFGVLSGSMIYNSANLAHGAYAYFRDRRVIDFRLASGLHLRSRPVDLGATRITAAENGAWALAVRSAPARALAFRTGAEVVRLSGGDAIHVASRVMPQVNQIGASRRMIQAAVEQLQDAGSPDAAFQRAADWLAGKRRGNAGPLKGAKFHQLPAEFRLVLEMAANEDVERRALEGELQLLEAAWRDAEEVAKIADDMFLPPEIDERLEGFRNPR